MTNDPGAAICRGDPVRNDNRDSFPRFRHHPA